MPSIYSAISTIEAYCRCRQCSVQIDPTIRDKTVMFQNLYPVMFFQEGKLLLRTINAPEFVSGNSVHTRK